MAYEYKSTTSGVFSFTVPGENRTVKLFKGDTITVEKQLVGTYLKMFKLVGEVDTTPPETKKPAEKKAPAKKATTKQKAKVADKITAVVETEEVPTPKEEVEVKTEDTVTEVIETPVEAEKPAPKRRGRKKKTS